MISDGEVAIALATTEVEIRRCYPVMQQLRPTLAIAPFVRHVLEQEHYHLAYLAVNGDIVSIAGFRWGVSFSWGRYLYVEDFVTDSVRRSRGYGKQLLDWLKRYARQHQCDSLHLDSGMMREAAHQFYLNQALHRSGYHFSYSFNKP
jgi:GNAT superfamily N-acetyltransferase